VFPPVSLKPGGGLGGFTGDGELKTIGEGVERGGSLDDDEGKARVCPGGGTGGGLTNFDPIGAAATAGLAKGDKIGFGERL
jgi:hypothetical protein